MALDASAYLLLAGLALKAGLFPLFFWLPASYHTPPAAIGAVFAGLLTKVGVYALIRVFTLLFQDAPPALFTLLLALAIVLAGCSGDDYVAPSSAHPEGKPEIDQILLRCLAADPSARYGSIAHGVRIINGNHPLGLKSTNAVFHNPMFG